MVDKLRSLPGVDGDAASDSSSRPDDDAEDPTVDVGPGAASADSARAARKFAQTFSGSGQLRGPMSVPSKPRVGVPRSLKQWERYQVQEVLGAGGMGAVYKAHDPRLNRFVALKIVHPGLGHEQGSTGDFFVKRFVREARLQASLDHPNICKVYEIGDLPGQDEESGYPYIAMQLISGQPLQIAHLEMSLFEKVRVIQLVAEALHFAHRQGLIHRDIKPSNIMVERTEDGKFQPYVMDFGLARDIAGAEHSRSGVIEGTPRFMSPEQGRGETKLLDRRTDVYSLGVTLYELLVGRSPYEATAAVDVLLAVLTVDPKPLRAVQPNIPIDLEAVTLKCLEKEPAGRYDSAKAFADDLGRYLDGEAVLARHVGLTQRLYRRARRHKALVALGAALLFSLLGLLTYGIRTRLVALERERRAQQQAELAQRLGQEISKMEWLLRSARQLPLHDLGREKIIVRKRMAQFQTELSGYGAMSRGLGHYALGRGHLALHEYPAALAELQQAQKAGNQSADVHYALGLVLGKHFEQAIFEARLSGGGDWAKKQLQELEPRYLTPAIDSLKRSRAMQSDAPEYLEALIAFYQRDYELALKKSEVAQLEAPWLYEAAKLRGDIHLERALQSRDSGKTADAEREFTAAVTSYKEAAAVGQSDGEVYAGLAEAWVRQIETALLSGRSTDAAYDAAVAASDQLTAAEPDSVAGRLKKGYAALMTMAGAGLTSAARVQQCLAEAQAVLTKEPDNPYASDVAAGCNAFAADGAQGRGEDAEPLLRKALGLMEPAVRRDPHFLWGLNDLANLYATLGAYLQTRGNPEMKDLFEKSIHFESMAGALDPSYIMAFQNLLFSSSKLVSTARSSAEMQAELLRADDFFAKCIAVNNQFQQCYINYLQVYSRAAQREYLTGADPRLLLTRALTTLATIRKLGGSFLDAEQHAALTNLVAASQMVRSKQDPAAALTDLRADLTRCFAIAAADAMCRTIAAQAERVAAEREAQLNRPPLPVLQLALQKAIEATRSPETYPDAWQVLADTYLRLAQTAGTKPATRDQYVTESQAALQKVFAINPRHALGLVTLGELELLHAQTQPETTARHTSAQTAVTALEQALASDALLTYSTSLLLSRAKALVAAP